MPRTQQPRLYRLPTSTIGEFAVERRLGGQPGVFTLYAARRLHGGGPVALHVLRFLADRPAGHHELMQAVELRERLGSAGLVPAIAAGRAPEGPWIATQLADDRTLAQLLDANGPLSLPRSLAILGPVAAALDAGHAHGLVCDSLTADTVLVSGEPALDEHGRLTDLGPTWAADIRPGRLLGDPGGLAPEEIRGAPPSPASNVYALAALLVRCLTGAPPFSAPTRAGVLSGHLFAPPPCLSERLRGLPASLDDLIASALAKDPRRRPASAAELIDRAAGTLGDDTAPEPPATDWPPPQAAPAPAVPMAGPPAADAVPEAHVTPRATARVGGARWAPSPRAMRAIRRVAVIVPAIALTVLAVIAALHSDPVKRTPRPTTAGPASAPQTLKTPAVTATLTPARDSGGRRKPTGAITIAADGNRRLLTVAARHLRAERRHPRQAYAVWLFNSRRDAALLGFVVPAVGRSGRFVSHRALPAQAGRYREVVITLESEAEARPEGPMVLRGELPRPAPTESPSRPRGR